MVLRVLVSVYCVVSQKANFIIYLCVSYHELLSCSLTHSHGLALVQFLVLPPISLSLMMHIITGSQRDVLIMVLRALVSVYCVVSLFNIQLADALHEGVAISPNLSPSTSPEMPLPAEFPPFHRKHLAPQQAEAPLHPPRYSRLVASVHPPTSSRFSKPSVKRNALSPGGSPGAGLVDIAPTQSSNGALPDDLTKPPLSPSISGKTLSILMFVFDIIHTLVFISRSSRLLQTRYGAETRKYWLPLRVSNKAGYPSLECFRYSQLEHVPERICFPAWSPTSPN